MVDNSQFKVIYGRKSKRENNTIYVREEDFQIPIGEDSFGMPTGELNRIQKVPIFNNKTIPELFAYDNFSLWWFMRSTIYPQFKKILNFTSKFLEFIENTKLHSIEITDFSYKEIIEQMCHKRGIKLRYSKISFLKFKIKNKLMIHMQRFRFKKIHENKIKKRKKLYRKKFNSLPSLHNKVIFAIPTIYRRYIINLETGESQKGEYIQQNIMNLLNKHEIIGIDLDYTFKGETVTLSERLNDKIRWFPLEETLTMHHNKSARHGEFLAQYRKIIRTDDFQKLFYFKDVALWKQLEYTFRQMLYPPFLPFYLNLFDSLLVFFKKEKPKAIFLPYETGPYALALIAISKSYGIKTVGIAHAVVDKNNPEYSHDQLANRENSYGFLLPDILLLFGEYSKQILVNQGYPIGQLETFGNPAYFDLNKLESILIAKLLRQKYKIAPNKKVILFGTGMLQEYYDAQGKYTFDSQVWRYLLENFANKEEYVIILKPHPQENTEVYEMILDEYNAKNACIIQGDLFELIYMSSVIISIFSTFMLDSLVFNKPVIRVEFEHIKHTIPYDEFGVIVSTDLNNLATKIRDVLNNEEIRNMLKKNTAHFLKYQFNLPEHNPEEILNRILE